MATNFMLTNIFFNPTSAKYQYMYIGTPYINPPSAKYQYISTPLNQYYDYSHV